jgi:hypothetical protein
MLQYVLILMRHAQKHGRHLCVRRTITFGGGIGGRFRLESTNEEHSSNIPQRDTPVGGDYYAWRGRAVALVHP